MLYVTIEKRGTTTLLAYPLMKKVGDVQCPPKTRRSRADR